MDWPLISPDLNPTENLWDILYTRVQGRQHHPYDVLTIRQALVEESAGLITEQYCTTDQEHANPMPRLC